MKAFVLGVSVNEKILVFSPLSNNAVSHFRIVFTNPFNSFCMFSGKVS